MCVGPSTSPASLSLLLLLLPEELAGRQRGWGGGLEEPRSAAATSTPLRRHRGGGLHQKRESCSASLLRRGSGGAPVVQDTDNSDKRERERGKRESGVGYIRVCKVGRISSRKFQVAFGRGENASPGAPLLPPQPPVPLPGPVAFRLLLKRPHMCLT